MRMFGGAITLTSSLLVVQNFSFRFTVELDGRWAAKADPWNIRYFTFDERDILAPNRFNKTVFPHSTVMNSVEI
jgi:hypothetical protein